MRRNRILTGNVGIGSTAPGAKLDVTANPATAVPVRIDNSSGGSDSQKSVSFTRASVEVGTITTTNANTAYNTSSDERLKKNIVDLVGGLDMVSRVRPRKFDWRLDGSHAIGFVAQELYKTYPQAVYAPEHGMWGVDYALEQWQQSRGEGK